MILTQEQVEHLRRKQTELTRLIDSKPKYGLFTFCAELAALNMIVELHNLEVAAENKALAEKKARIEKGKENLGIK